jgi:hypothetical protein
MCKPALTSARSSKQAWMQLHAGATFPTFEKTDIALPHIAKGWFPAIRTFLGSVDASLCFPTAVLPCLTRANDCILMDDVLSNDFRPQAVDKINLCRLFLQVESFAKICKPAGDCIHNSVWKGNRPRLQSKFLWPCQSCPHEASWQPWCQCSQLVCLHPDKQKANSRSTDLRLEQTLGPWIAERHLQVRRWRTCLSANGEHLRHHQNNCLHRSARADSCSRHTHHCPQQSVVVPSLPTDAIPVTELHFQPTRQSLAPQAHRRPRPASSTAAANRFL